MPVNTAVNYDHDFLIKQKPALSAGFLITQSCLWLFDKYGMCLFELAVPYL